MLFSLRLYLVAGCIRVFQLIGLRSEHAESSCIHLPITVRVSKTSELKFLYPLTPKSDGCAEILLTFFIQCQADR